MLGKLPFSPIDNKITLNVNVDDNNESKATNVTDHKTAQKVSVVNKHNSVVEIIEIDKPPISCPINPDHSDESISIPNASIAEDEQDSELDASHLSNDELSKTTLPDKVSTQRQDERDKKKLEKLKEKEVLLAIR